jgi:hypothetical protein
MHIAAHRDGDADGLTTIQDTRRYPDRAGFAGFTSAELLPHTDRSGIPEPPRLMLLVCASPADQGGDSLLVDARQVHADLGAHQRQAADLLAEPRTAFFGAGDGAGGGHVTQVFTAHPAGRVSARLRQDSLARWSPLLQPHLSHLHSALTRHQRLLRLTAGQAYLLDNTRWLHGRTAFAGRRRCWRVLGNPRFPLPPGFAPIRDGPHRGEARPGRLAQTLPFGQWPDRAGHSAQRDELNEGQR